MDSFAKFTDASGTTETVFEIKPDVADALVAALRRSVGIDPPRHAQTMGELVAVIAQSSRIITHLEGLRELAIVEADKTHPHADRKKLGIAAGWPPSRIYRVLERHGRPRNRSASS